MNTVEILKKYGDYKLPQVLPDIIAAKVDYPHTEIVWSDGSRTKVTMQEDDTWDTEKGIMAAMAKRAYGNGIEHMNQVREAQKGIAETAKMERLRTAIGALVATIKQLGTD